MQPGAQSSLVNLFIRQPRVVLTLWPDLWVTKGTAQRGVARYSTCGDVQNGMDQVDETLGLHPANEREPGALGLRRPLHGPDRTEKPSVFAPMRHSRPPPPAPPRSSPPAPPAP